MAKRERLKLEMAMEKNVEQLLNRVSLVFAAIATLALLNLFLHSSSLSCSPVPTARVARHDRSRHSKNPSVLPASLLPRTSCDAASREVLTPDKRLAKLRSSRVWRSRVDAFSALFATLRSAGILTNASHVLCVFSGAGHDVAALQESGVADVTGVDILDFHPLVLRADPHNLPFFDNVFDLAFSADLAGALFPARFVSEMERTVRVGGAVALAVDRYSTAQDAEVIKALFKRSRPLEVRYATTSGPEMRLIIMIKKGKML